MKKPKTIKKEHIKCYICNKPIHIDDFGGINKEGFFHNDLFCLIFILDKASKNDKR